MAVVCKLSLVLFTFFLRLFLLHTPFFSTMLQLTMNDQARLPTSLYAVVQWFLAVLFIWVTVHSLSSTVCISALLPSRQPMLVEFWRLKDTDTGEFERALRESSLFKALT